MQQAEQLARDLLGLVGGDRREHLLVPGQRGEREQREEQRAAERLRAQGALEEEGAATLGVVREREEGRGALDVVEEGVDDLLDAEPAEQAVVGVVRQEVEERADHPEIELPRGPPAEIDVEQRTHLGLGEPMHVAPRVVDGVHRVASPRGIDPAKAEGARVMQGEEPRRLRRRRAALAGDEQRRDDPPGEPR